MSSLWVGVREWRAGEYKFKLLQNEQGVLLQSSGLALFRHCALTLPIGVAASPY